MANSGEKINYSLRPAKNAERKMMAEYIKRIVTFEIPDEYEYIGFGSFYFADFKLFHKVLGIKKMTSLELPENIQKAKRFNFNKPYGFINIVFNTANDYFLPLEPAKRIVWFDYDGQLKKEIIDDIKITIPKLSPRSVFIISLNIDPQYYRYVDDSSGEEEPLSLFKSLESFMDCDLENDYGIDPKISSLSTLRKAIYNILYRAVEEAVDTHSLASMTFEQIFNFQYKDGATMLTLGFIFYDQTVDTKDSLDKFSDKLDYVNNKHMPYMIETPKLTLKEIHKIDKIHGECEILDPFRLIIDKYSIEHKLQKEYLKIQRFFPNFLEMET